MKKERFVYHAVPEALEGEYLHPLNEMRERHPVIFEQAVAKYEGRERLLLKKVLPLACLWNDVLMFTPVHPARVREAIKARGRTRPVRSWYEIPAELLHGDNTVLYFAPAEQPHDLADSSEEEFQPFSSACLDGYQDVPAQAIEYYRSVPSDAPLFPFQFIPHVLFKGSIRITELSVIEA